MVRRQRRGRASTAPTIGPPFVPQLISRRQRSTERKKRAPPPPSLTAGDPTARWQRSRPIGCSRRGDRDMLRRGTPLLRHHGVVVRRVAMSVFESCGNKQKNPGELRHPNCNLRSATTNSRKTYPNTGAPANCTLTCRNASVTSILLNTMRARGPKRRRRNRMRPIIFRNTRPNSTGGACAKSVSALTLCAY